MDTILPLLKTYIKENTLKGSSYLPQIEKDVQFFQQVKPLPKNQSPIKQTPPQKPAKTPVKPLPPKVVPPKEEILPTDEFAKLYQKIAPGMHLRSAPLTMEKAPSIILLFDSKTSPHQTILHNLTTAINAKLAPAKCLDISKNEHKHTPPPKLVIAIEGLELPPTFKEIKTITIPLKNLDLYEKNPQLKKVLWEEIKGHIPKKMA